jgi:hypothetical protein
MFSSAPRAAKPKSKAPQKAKVGISPDVNSLIKSMMKSAKLSNGQQDYLDSFITSDNGALPLSRPALYKPSARYHGKVPAVKVQQSRPNRRQLGTIIDKGDLKAEPYRPKPVKSTSRAVEIERLSDAMSRGGSNSFMDHSSFKKTDDEGMHSHSSGFFDEEIMCMFR